MEKIIQVFFELKTVGEAPTVNILLKEIKYVQEEKKGGNVQKGLALGITQRELQSV
jgi:hypothetical protein